MKKLLTVAALLLPLVATAQYEPVPQPGYAPAPAPGASYSRRGPWYIGFGIGTGDGKIKFPGGSFTLKEEHDFLWGGSTSPTNITLNFKVGATLTPNLLLGFDVTAIRSQYDSSGFSTGVQINNYDAVVTFFPMGEGPFLRGGAGFSSIIENIDTPIGNASASGTGFNALVGAGYAFWIGRSFNLTLNADYSFQNYGSNDLDVDASSFWNLWVGFDWY